VGWFGFNAGLSVSTSVFSGPQQMTLVICLFSGSALSTGASAVAAVVASQLSAAASGLVWLTYSWVLFNDHDIFRILKF
jgi:ammonia channel protein AmtB